MKKKILVKTLIKESLVESSIKIGDKDYEQRLRRRIIDLRRVAQRASEAAKKAEEAIQDQIDIIDGAVDVEGSFRKAIKDQADAQDAIDKAQDQRVKNLEDKVGNDGGTAEESTGLVATLRGAIEAEAQERQSADATHDSRLTAIEELIGDGEGSTTLADLNARLTEAEKDIDQCQKDIIANANAIAAIVALEESDIDAAFNAVFQ